MGVHAGRAGKDQLWGQASIESLLSSNFCATCTPLCANCLALGLLAEDEPAPPPSNGGNWMQAAAAEAPAANRFAGMKLSIPAA